MAVDGPINIGFVLYSQCNIMYYFIVRVKEINEVYPSYRLWAFDERDPVTQSSGFLRPIRKSRSPNMGLKCEIKEYINCKTRHKKIKRKERIKKLYPASKRLPPSNVLWKHSTATCKLKTKASTTRCTTVQGTLNTRPLLSPFRIFLQINSSTAFSHGRIRTFLSGVCFRLQSNRMNSIFMETFPDGLCQALKIRHDIAIQYNMCRCKGLFLV